MSLKRSNLMTDRRGREVQAFGSKLDTAGACDSQAPPDPFGQGPRLTLRLSWAEMTVKLDTIPPRVVRAAEAN